MRFLLYFAGCLAYLIVALAEVRAEPAAPFVFVQLPSAAPMRFAPSAKWDPIFLSVFFESGRCVYLNDSNARFGQYLVDGQRCEKPQP